MERAVHVRPSEFAGVADFFVGLRGTIVDILLLVVLMLRGRKVRSDWAGGLRRGGSITNGLEKG